MLTVTLVEPRFTRADKEILLASRRLENAPRGRHGLLLSEAMDPANQFAFEVPPPSTDWAQAALNSAQDKFAALWPEADMDSFRWTVVKNPR